MGSDSEGTGGAESTSGERTTQGSDGDSADDGVSTTGDDSGSTAEPIEDEPQLDHAAWNPDSAAFEFSHESVPSISVVGAPADADPSRSAMLHDGTNQLLYLMQEGADAVYQLDFDPGLATYVHDGAPSIPLVDFPGYADRSSFAMLHDGGRYRLYFLSVDHPLRLIQGAFDPDAGAFVHGFASIPEIDVVGTPAGSDWSGWAALNDGETFRLYVFASAAHDSVFEHTYDGMQYQFGLEVAEPIGLTMIPNDADRDDFAMLHNGTTPSLYLRGEP
ncbi:MAG: hypothetical protein K0V04_25995 [Deltaproteobacteria bacterium]|nr:hypothetical protein [Deltaproteobacteria bacterium]